MSKLISILGAGESGVGAALLAKAKGYNVFVSDKGEIKDKYKKILLENHIDFEEGTHSEDVIFGSIEVVKSPGISDKVALIEMLLERNIPVISEIEFASRFTKATFIGITGSNGKTTTTLLTYHLLKKLGLNVGLAGNVGSSLALQIIEDSYDYYVLELSSFQLDGVINFHPHIAVLLNITPDHLDRYDYIFQNYINSKFRITQKLTAQDYFIYWDGDAKVINELAKKNLPCSMFPVSLNNSSKNAKTIASSDQILFSDSQAKIDTSQLPIQGNHNLINAMCAMMVAKALGFDENLFVTAMQDFKNAEHRLETVKMINGVTYINDSKATNVDSVYYALESMKKPVVLIAGGVDKGNEYAQIENLVKQKVKAMVCMGIDNSKLFAAFEGKVKLINTHSLAEAMQACQSIATDGDVVLLSPSCASFDLFKNYEDRGTQFKEAVNNLAS